MLTYTNIASYIKNLRIFFGTLCTVDSVYKPMHVYIAHYNIQQMLMSYIDNKIKYRG